MGVFQRWWAGRGHEAAGMMLGMGLGGGGVNLPIITTRPS